LTGEKGWFSISQETGVNSFEDEDVEEEDIEDEHVEDDDDGAQFSSNLFALLAMSKNQQKEPGETGH
jgi:hypothetical protein